MLVNKVQSTVPALNLDYAVTQGQGGFVANSASPTPADPIDGSARYAVSFTGQLPVGQLGLERDLVREWPGGHRDEPELGRDARGGRREHG